MGKSVINAETSDEAIVDLLNRLSVGYNEFIKDMKDKPDDLKIIVLNGESSPMKKDNSDSGNKGTSNSNDSINSNNNNDNGNDNSKSTEQNTKQNDKQDDNTNKDNSKDEPVGVNPLFERYSATDEPCDCSEFMRQLKGQEEGMNELTVAQYLENKKEKTAKSKEKDEAKKNENSKPKNSRTRGIARERIRTFMLKHHFNGDKKSKAYNHWNKWFRKQAALHNPDQIAGGNDEITDFGNISRNSSLGSQWKERHDSVYKKVKDKKPNEKLNVRLDSECKRKPKPAKASCPD